MEDKEILKHMKYSITSIGTFEQCRQKFKFQYIDKLGKKTQSIDAFMGSCVHKAMEVLYTDLKNGKRRSLEETLQVFDDEWEVNFNDAIIFAKKEYTAEDYRNVGRKCVENYYRSHEPFDDMNIIGLETDDTLHLDDGIDYYVRIDKLACKGDTFFVCDYKTNSKMKTQEEADSDRQLAMYAEWVRRTYGTNDIKLIWHMVRFDRDVFSTRTEEQLSSLVNDTVSTIKTIQNCGEWLTNPTALCDYCEFHDICPEYSHVVKVDKEIEEKHFTEDEGAKLVDEYMKLDSDASEIIERLDAIKERKDAIKRDIAVFAKQYWYNSVGGTDKQANVRWERKAKIPDDKVSDVISVLRDEGILSDYQKFDKTKAEKDIASGNNEKISGFAEISDVPKVTFGKKK